MMFEVIVVMFVNDVCGDGDTLATVTAIPQDAAINTKLPILGTHHIIRLVGSFQGHIKTQTW